MRSVSGDAHIGALAYADTGRAVVPAEARVAEAAAPEAIPVAAAVVEAVAAGQESGIITHGAVVRAHEYVCMRC